MDVGHVRTIRHGDERLHGLDQRRQLRDQGRKRDVKEQDLVFSMVDDVVDLFREQTRVDGVQHRAAARNAVIQGQMAV